MKMEVIKLEPILEIVGNIISLVPMGMKFKGKMTLDEAILISSGLEKVNDNIQMWWGDFLNKAESLFGEEYSQCYPDGVESKTVLNWKWVAHKVPLDLRLPGLKFAHLSEVAGLDDLELMKEILERAVKENLSSNDIREILKPKIGKERKTTTYECPKCGHIWERKKGDK